MRNPDGTYTLYFGYLNRNRDHSLSVPLGPQNSFEPGGDRGQPTYFLPRRQMFVFTVALPKDWDPSKSLVWTLSSEGRTEKAYGSLLPVWEIDQQVIMANRGFGVGQEAPEENQPPTIEGDRSTTVALGDSLTLTVSARDDGIPKPAAARPPRTPETPPTVDTVPPRRPRNQAGLRVNWIQYRGGPGIVTFDPEITPIKGGSGTATTTARFSQPGEYLIRAIADDGIYTTPLTIKVTVAAPGTTASQ
jgi:hypothetical protein